MILDLGRELELACRLARQAGALILELRASGLKVDHKAGQEPVTQADLEANALLVAGLSSAFPDDAILSEEAPDDGTRLRRSRVWMVDPLDGTKDFIRGYDGFSTMIGLVEGERPVLGVVYQPVGDRLYQAVRGRGAWLKEGGGPAQRLKVSEVSEPAALRLVASRTHRQEVIDRVRSTLGVTDELNVGSVGLKLGLIARGDRDLYVNPASRSSLWDTCGPEAILVEAGGRLTDLAGAPLDYRAADVANRRGLVASNGLVHEHIVARLSELFRPG